MSCHNPKAVLSYIYSMTFGKEKITLKHYFRYFSNMSHPGGIHFFVKFETVSPSLLILKLFLQNYKEVFFLKRSFDYSSFIVLPEKIA